MRIAQIIDGMRLAGGAERLQETLARELSAYDVELTIITMGSDDLESVRALERLGVRVVRFPARRFLSPSRALRLRAFLRAERFDVVHTHLVRSTLLGAVTARSAGTPVVATIHNAIRNPRLSRALLGLEELALRHWVDRVIAVGWETALAHGPRLPGVHIEVLPNAVPTPERVSHEERRKVREELGVDEDECLCVAVGRLARAKNFALLIDAFDDVARISPAARLRIVGEGTLRGDLERRIGERGLEERVSLTGLRRDVEQILQSSDVYVSASDYEGLPLATLEAMQAGLPVVATKVGDVPRVVSEETGRLVAPGDRSGLAREIAALVEDEALRLRLGHAGRERATERFGTERWAREHLRIYGELAGRVAAPEEGGR